MKQFWVTDLLPTEKESPSTCTNWLEPLLDTEGKEGRANADSSVAASESQRWVFMMATGHTEMTKRCRYKCF